MILIRLIKSSILTASQEVNSNSIPACQAMSKKRRPIQLIPAAFVLILQFFTFAAGQDAVSIVVPEKGAVASISGQTVDADRRSILFADTIATQTGLSTRISELKLYDSEGVLVAFANRGAGEFVAASSFKSWSYKIDLTQSGSRSAVARTSWLGARFGVLFLNDILPQQSSLGQLKRTIVKFEIPLGWRASSTGRVSTAPSFEISDLSNGVVVVGKDLLEIPIAHPSGLVHIALDGTWNFRHFDTIETFKEVRGYYQQVFAGWIPGEIQVNFVKFPMPVNSAEWEADARGKTITIISSDMPFPNQSVQRLHEQLRHEIFHLWIPSGVNLTGNYDWFYEGFALYQSLKLGVAVNRIRFDDYLDTLSRAYQIDSATAVRKSMVEESANRWAGSNTTVYARGMLVAFMCDLAMLEASKGKRSTNDLLRELYSKHSGAAASQDGNATVLALLKRRPELVQIADRHVTGVEKLDLTQLIESAGIEMQSADRSAKLSVVAKPTGRQKDLLDKLGYNNWRKLANGK